MNLRVSPFCNPTEITDLSTELDQLLISKKKNQAQIVCLLMYPHSFAKGTEPNLNKPLNSCEGNSEDRTYHSTISKV